MTYLGILELFLLPPLLLLLLWVPRDVWRWIWRDGSPVNWKPYLYILLNIALALIYTTPWDNYLVATGVWWYDPELITGLTLGWVPVEEYIFFILQTALTGLWALAVQRSILREKPVIKQSARVRWWSSSLLAAGWLASTALLLSRLAGWHLPDFDPILGADSGAHPDSFRGRHTAGVLALAAAHNLDTHTIFVVGRRRGTGRRNLDD